MSLSLLSFWRLAFLEFEILKVHLCEWCYSFVKLVRKNMCFINRTLAILKSERIIKYAVNKFNVRLSRKKIESSCHLVCEYIFIFYTVKIIDTWISDRNVNVNGFSIYGWSILLVSSFTLMISCLFFPLYNFFIFLLFSNQHLILL